MSLWDSLPCDMAMTTGAIDGFKREIGHIHEGKVHLWLLAMMVDGTSVTRYSMALNTKCWRATGGGGLLWLPGSI